MESTEETQNIHCGYPAGLLIGNKGCILVAFSRFLWESLGMFFLKLYLCADLWHNVLF
jgi:hypothetical protein